MNKKDSPDTFDLIKEKISQKTGIFSDFTFCVK